MAKLTKKQTDFCLHYVNTGNASEAYRLSYSTERMKKTTIRYKARDLLKLGHITAMIDYLKAEERDRINKTYTVEKDKTIQEYNRLAFVDIRKLFNRDGTLKNTDELDDDVAAAIGSINVSESVEGGRVTRTTRIKLLDKRGPLQDLAKMLGLFAEDNGQNRDETKNLQLNVNFIEANGELK